MIILILAVLVLIVYLIKGSSSSKEEMVRQTTTVGLLQQQLEAIRQSQEKYSQTMEKNLKDGQQNIDKHLILSRETLGKLQNQLGTLKGDSERMLQLGSDVRSLQDILKSPKLRGQLGEQSLEKILAEILPHESFALQHSFSNGKVVDALVKMPDYAVPIDAKFPLPTFEAMIKAENDDTKEKLRRTFLNDVIKHIDKIAVSYINPDEGTLDFALMYIPAENVYYETIIKYAGEKKDLLSYALEKKVIPVSPNLLYAYLMTIVMGLRGLQIEKQADLIQQNMAKLAGNFETFLENYSVLGRHLRNAQGQYDEGQTKLNKFTLSLEQIKHED